MQRKPSWAATILSGRWSWHPPDAVQAARLFPNDILPAVPASFSSADDASLRQVERDVTAAFGRQSFDLDALLAVSNIFRAATAVRHHMEQQVLRAHQLGWSAFVVLFVLRVWGPRQPHELATEAGVTPGTLTGVLTTLERRGLVERRAHPTDGRRLTIRPTRAGKRTIDAIMPVFNQRESEVTAGLSAAERTKLSDLLRTILRTLDDR